MHYQEAMLALEAGKKLSRNAWKGVVICKKLNGVDMIPWRKISPVMKALEEKVGLHVTQLDSVWAFDIPGHSIQTGWEPTAEDMEANDWRTVFVKPCKCRVCGKWFDYGDEQSPVFKDDVWNQVLREHGFEEKQPVSIEHPHDDTGFICYECVERTLGRKITKDDLANVSFNEPFNEFYFKDLTNE